MKNIIIGILILLSMFAGISNFKAETVAALESCSVTLANPYINPTAVTTWGKFSCPAPATPKVRYLQICLYQSGVQKACNYAGTGVGAEMQIFISCQAVSSTSTARFTAWVWFQDKYGATYAKWSGDSYLYRRCKT